MDKQTEVLLRLLQLPRLGVIGINKILAHISPESLCDYDRGQLAAMGWSAQQINTWFHPPSQVMDNVKAWLQKPGNHLINCLQPGYPNLLKQIAAAPPLLFVSGDIHVLSRPQIAMVGSRNYSDYGRYCAARFASELSLAGFVITSGLALGIDSFCHHAVVAQQGQTLAVLGSGLNRIYPRRNHALAQDILHQGGALVSELLPDYPPLAENFPRRNRLISGLSLATLVIEASARSGSLITAAYALEQNREVFAVPGSIRNEYSRGCHQLIKQGAILTETAADMLENLHIYPSLLLNSSADSPPPSPQAALRAKPKPEYPALYELIGDQALSADRLAELSALPIEQVLVQLLALELQELIINDEGGYRRRT
ncbi:DNA processing protein [Mesocricetibacter intestinalis]|uniref:DNA processing protein n=1 Tax=Mesocricetibacter intestinalis TaxID=1521930 RepID=A0A4R6VAC9_9PAST|nr:DNA-processing protein DprA [Mesocricetibacter intestinalis]TDQ56678.1 DNA processing protein [Mesocricetibacter intestinalis]